MSDLGLSDSVEHESSLFNSTMAENTSSNLMSLDDYINKALPLHLDKMVADHLQNGSLLHDDHKESTAPLGAVEASDDNWAMQRTLRLLQQGQQHISVESSSSFSSWSFLQGLIVGQITVVIVLIFFIKFFIFSESTSSKPNNPKNATGPSLSSRPFISSQFISSIMKRGGKEQINSAENVEAEQTRQIDAILEKTYYDVNTHPSESLDWFNVLIAQTIQQFREEAWQKDNIVHSLNNFVEKKLHELPSYIDGAKITELDIGDDFPIFSNCRVQYVPNSNRKKLEAKIDIDLNDRLAIGVETKLLLNYPKPATAALPINITVAIVRFQACLTVSLTKAEEFVAPSSPTQENNGSGYFLVFSFAPEYRMDFETESLIGARSKLENIPKIGSLIEYQIKKWFVERCVEPRFQFVRLPSMWPRSKRTWEGKPEAEGSKTSRES
ncbi:hypothetical protein HG536_0E04290 [Torulaspora globosa]|uniref:Maintenance of mitochondrial morphology protein 1 n=1 Tax=Torulaspora globosa TaxID=48254 RepID=A0A7G3ZJ32_9SACH|nr:uncharacterized protein HG536_0E04290 [Torulaspora globosa]QLL33518.1 hypothetical protein HG536_0E04290 [Torulaspora globosa]